MYCVDPEMGLLLCRMEKPLYEFVMECFERSDYTYQEIADGSGVSRRTVEKIARREIEDPGVSNVQKISDFFRTNARRPRAAAQTR